MNSLIDLRYDGAPVRVLDIEGEPWFVASDVARVLGYSNERDAISRHCKGANNTVVKRDGIRGNPNVTIIPERDVYRLIMRSKLPAAERFEEWVVGEVLPSIRKTGKYQAMPQSFAEALQLAADQARQLEQQRPAIEFYEAVTDSKTALPMAQVAKVLDMGIGRNKLFEVLRDNKVLRRNNEPYQEYIDKGWFRVVEQKYQTSDGETHVTTKTLVYQKGVDGIKRLID